MAGLHERCNSSSFDELTSEGRRLSRKQSALTIADRRFEWPGVAGLYCETAKDAKFPPIRIVDSLSGCIQFLLRHRVRQLTLTF